MPKKDTMRAWLQARGCPPHVVKGGFSGLIKQWQQIVTGITAGYAMGLEDYLNDLDVRQLLEEALQQLPQKQAARRRSEIARIDAQLRAAVKIQPYCLYGQTLAGEKGWHASDQWWYYAIPLQPGDELAGDLAHQMGDTDL